MNISKRSIIYLGTIITFICFVIGAYQFNQHSPKFFEKTASINDLSAICNDKEYYENQFKTAYSRINEEDYNLNIKKVVSAKAKVFPHSEESTKDSAYQWICEYKVILNQPVVSGYNVPNPEHSVLLGLDLSAYCNMNYNKYIYSVCR